MKRILCLVSGMDAGGAETFLMKLYRNIDRTLYQMDFAVNVKEPAFYDEEILSMGGKIHYIPQKTKDFMGFTKGLYKLVKEEQYQYVLRITSNSIGFYDLLVAKKAGAKVCAARSSNSSDGGRVDVRVVNRLARLLFLRFVDVMIAPSDLAAEYTFGKKQVKKGKVYFLKNAINLNEFSYSEKSREEVRSELGLSNEFLLGHIGRFAEQKNHRFLIDIFEEVSKKIPEVKLLLVGTGELRKDIENYVKEKNLQNQVIFAGVRKDIAKVLSALDLFILPSLYEGMPNVIIEAQAAGLPCLIADTITREANLTRLVKYISLENVNDWTVEIDRVYADKNKRDGQNEKMKNSGYDIKEVVNKFTTLMTN